MTCGRAGDRAIPAPSNHQHCVGKALHNELKGVHSARRGAFRVPYQIDDGIRLVTVLRVEHRADVYRPR
jgi:mRNA-degrading endonuclease RelE of RelBE toxin-antitoxin system